MCQKKPGARCSNHTKKTYAKAQKTYEANPTPENKKALDKAKADYYTSPEGIKRLRDAGKHEAASKMQARRDRANERLKAVEAFENSDAWTQQRVISQSVHESARATGFEVESLDWNRNPQTGLIDVYVQLGYKEDYAEMDYSMLGDSSVLSVSDFSDPRTVDADLAAHAERANEAVDSGNDVAMEGWEVRPFIDHNSYDLDSFEVTDFSDAIGDVRVEKPALPYSAGAVKDHYQMYLEQQVEESDDPDDLRAIIAHPLATDYLRNKAEENLAYLND